MALTDDAVFIPGTGFVYIAPAETVEPVSLTSPASPWENLGHTSRDDGLTITRDGGDSEVLGTWQNDSLRERVDPTTLAVTLFAHQVDQNVLGLYFPGGDDSTPGRYGVTSASGSAERAMYIRIVDGTNEVGLYMPKVSIRSDDDVEVDVEGFLAFPLRATVLQVTGSNLMDFIGDSVA
jgi:hypothetical protein